MRYEGRLFRPPSEARSYILQATIGCKHNTCAFCDMYFEKVYRERPLKDILEDIQMASNAGYNPDRLFIADGDALAMSTENIVEILREIKHTFNRCKRIGIYATARDVIEKGVDDLKRLKGLGLGIIYLGLESGDDDILERMNKADGSKDMILAAKIVKEAGIKISVTVISGLGGQSMWKQHADATAAVLSDMNPDYIGLLTLMLSPNTPVTKWIDDGSFKLLSPKEILQETRCIIENLEVDNCVFRSNHASNYISLSAQLPTEKQALLDQIDEALGHHNFKPEGYRRL